MTQPPQGPAPDNPPNQPPAFGAPQGPPPGYPPSPPAFGEPQGAPAAPSQPPAFGAPAAPPQPPAFGGPQGAPAAPPQPPAFGAPQGPPAPPAQPPAGPPPAPPAGYGYPQASPQPAYGYPAPAGYGYPGQPGPAYPSPPTAPAQPQAESRGDNGLKAQILIVASALVAIALIIGGGVWYSGSQDDGGNEAKSDGKASASPTGATGGGTEKAPADPKGKLLFQLPVPAVAKGDSADTDGSWVTDKVYAKSGLSEVNGYDLDKGTKLWTVKLPGPVCAAAHWLSADGTKTGILFKPATPTKDKYQPCNQVGALDLNTGKLLWTKTATAGDYALSFDSVTVSANTVAAAGTSGGAAFDISTGKLLWQPKTADTCGDRGYGGGPKLVAIRKCGDYDNPVLSAQTLDPATGKVVSEYKLATGIEYASVVSTDPLVIGADVGDSAGDGSGLSDLFSIDGATGQLRARISVPGDDYGADCEISQADGCEGVIAGGDRLYIQTEDNSGATKQIVAFDVLTGKQTGQRADGGEDFDLYPLRMDGKNLIVYKGGSYDKGGQVLSIDGTTFKQTVLLQNPDDQASVDAETDMSPGGTSEILFAQGRLFLSQTYVSDSDRDEQLAIAYGPAS
ncbi:PQQ-binding-like beta-propeller repeat protein [Streptomyces sp. 4F14]|uniref:outer membrane protein assembly factor BamB family protein n=1 Tax=Streptomyces sp. 4F14 TaxID=3394380 RepID=UPI003A8BE2FA